jgi:hypothetical protein
MLACRLRLSARWLGWRSCLAIVPCASLLHGY